MSKSKAKKIEANRTNHTPERARPPDIVGETAQSAGTSVESMTTPRADAKAKTDRTPLDRRNGITRPGAETMCGKVWAALDNLRQEGKEIGFEALRAVVDGRTADATIRTQRQRWKQYNTEKADGQ